MSGVKIRSKSILEEKPSEQAEVSKMAANKPVEGKSTTIKDLMIDFKKNQEGNVKIEAKLGTIEKKVDDNTKNLNDHVTNYNKGYEDINEKCQSMKTRADGHDRAIADLQDRISQADRGNLFLRERVYELEKIARDLNFRDEEARRQNIIIQEIPEANYMKSKQAVTKLLSTLGVQVSSATVSNLHTVGKYVDGKKNKAYQGEVLRNYTRILVN